MVFARSRLTAPPHRPGSGAIRLNIEGYAMDGIKAALELAGGAAGPPAPASQLDLLAADNAELDAKLPLGPPPAPRGAGRPPGARNKRTQQLAAYYLGRYGDPLEGLLSLATGDLRHTVAQLRALSAETGLAIHVEKVDGELVRCEPTLLSLLEFKRDALEAVLPYLHAKLAPTNDKGEAVVPILALGSLRDDAEAMARAGVVDLEALVDITPQDQGLSAIVEGASHGGPSHGDA
jgi:hypothetical protein